MLLKSLFVKNFRCYSDVSNIPLHRLTVFIGENDAGKTVLLAALELLLTNKRPSSSDYIRISDDEQADTIVISGVFSLEPHDTIPRDFCSMDDMEFTLTKTFTLGSNKFTVKGKGFDDTRWNTFDKESADVQKELLKGISIPPGSNKSKRIEQFEEAVESGILLKQASLLEVSWTQIEEHLPLFHYTSSVDYKKPDSMIQRTMHMSLDTCLRPINPDTNEQDLLPELKEVERRIREELNSEIAEVKKFLHRANPKIIDIQVNPTIDFTRSVSTTNLMLDLGNGLQFVDAFGEGTKKKLWLGLLDWERDVQSEFSGRSVIRAYDEPDVNLDYEAKHKLFTNILADTEKINSLVQSIICTHEVTMIDQAPASSINLIKVADDNSRTVDHLHNSDDESVRDFLAMLSRTVGISNSAIFYEKAFIIVEGQSEETALPILYRNLYGHSYVQDRIKLIDLRTCGAWKSVLHILLDNRADISIMLLDQDCTDPNSSGYVTDTVLAEIGYPSGWKDNNCFYIGTKEFEDAFQFEDIVIVLNNHWPKENQDVWTVAEIERFNVPGGKFSSDLLAHVRRTCSPSLRSSARKPDFAEKLAQHCQISEQIPQKIQDVFAKARAIAGVHIHTE